MCKDAVNMDSTCQSIFRRLCTTKKIEDFSFPVSSPDDVFIPSGCPSVHCSIRPDDVFILMSAKYCVFGPLDLH
jgi:hypothetical protein